MRSFDKYRDVKYLQQSDVAKDKLLTIKAVTEEDVSSNDRPEKMKFVIHFEERGFLPWVANVGSLKKIAEIAGTGDVDRWPGTVIVVYVNPDVEFAGEVKGGIRCRAPKNQPPVNEQPPATQPSVPNPDWVGEDPALPPEDDIPF